MTLVSSPTSSDSMLQAVWPVIKAEMELRRSDRQPLLDHMQDVQNRYNGDWAVPYPRKDRGGPDLPPLGPAIISDTIDSTGMSAGSVVPEIFCPSMDPGVKKFDQEARKRKQSMEYVWWASGFKLLARKWFRQLAGYGTFGIIVFPDMKTECPRIRAVDPLGMFPEERASGDMRPPSSVGTIHLMHRDQITAIWPHAMKTNSSSNRGVITPQGPQMWEVLEWIDANQRVFGILGPRDTYGMNRRGETREASMPLHWGPNPVGMCTVLTPERITLEKIVSQVQHILGMTDLMSRLMALDILSSEKSIFPDRVITGNSNNPPQLVDGEWHDGIDGKPNIILNADQVMTMGNSPDQNVKVGVDRLERNAKVSGGLVPQQVGETPGGGLRTGRANEAIYASAVEPRLQEMHEIFEHWASPMNDIIVETYKAYWPDKKYVVYSGERSHKEIARFTPTKDLKVSWNRVSYAIPGASSSRVTVELSQMFGAGAIAMADYRRMHPNITDSDATENAINLEAIDASLRRSIEVGIENGTITGEDIVVVRKAIASGEDLVDAFAEMLEAAKIRQAEMLAEQQAQQQGQPPPLSSMPGANPPDAEGLGAAGLMPAPASIGPPGTLGAPSEKAQTVGPNANQAGLFNLIGATKKGLN